MSGLSKEKAVWRLGFKDEGETQRLALELSHLLRADDLVTLSGNLGAGKTTFARALIRALTGDSDVEVPSPTYTLMQVYQAPHYPIIHADLFRLNDPRDLAQLGWDEASAGALVIVEWAERAGDQLPPDRLDVFFALDVSNGEEARRVEIAGHGAFAARLERGKAIHALLETSGWRDATRAFMLGDASARAYERLTKPNGERAILMISPPRPDGPPIRGYKSYSAIARLAENMTPFVAVAQALRAQSLSAPAIHASDLGAGLAILEDLGPDLVVDENGPIPERYAESAAVLAALHSRRLPEVLLVDESTTYAIPRYDMDALLIEVELLPDWYAPAFSGTIIEDEARDDFIALWKAQLAPIVESERTWSLRDYHSPNLIWLPEREGLRRVGVIDFQDCVLGHPAYDVVSLLQDARVTVSNELELRLLSHYARKRREADPGFDMAAFARAYAALGAQRATKILGIFARLDKRDHKPQYLTHVPRVERYLAKDLAHPALADLRAWYEQYVPGIFPAET